MSLPRFYCPNILASGAVVSLPVNAAQHASRALRLQEGDGVILFNGDGNDYTAKLVSIRKNEVTAGIKSVSKNTTESPIKVTLAQAISSGDRMDYTIQKAVEMGVAAIQPIASQRSVVKLNGERAEKRREHWQNVVISACEQSGRAIVPEVSASASLANWLGLIAATGNAFHTRITLSPTAEQTLADLLKPEGDICLLVGAEGGLSEEEIALAATHGFTPVRLGNRILRTETAGLAALAAMQALWGDF
ncbi:MAG TPA: 16S rRNA (uracil(1498)-N(3))-methyltransferase [Methylophilaceae bacterium]|nr:16S rRNA (uracil(1498)-N(3))-methyltransferase [Methylophilaceae bacterium]